MCVSSGKSQMELTKILVAVEEKSNKIFHHLVYGNLASADNKTALLIPIPTTENIEFLDSRPYGEEIFDLFTYYDSCLKADTHTRGVGFENKGITVTNVGNYSYTHGHVSHIAEMGKMAGIKITDELEKFYTETYKDWILVFAMWEGAVDNKHEPIHIKYEPNLYPSDLFIYLMDGHDGRAPQSNQVHRDHQILVSIRGKLSGTESLLMKLGKEKFKNKKPYSDNLKKAIGLSESLYPIWFDRIYQNGISPNGDLWLNLNVTFENTIHDMVLGGNNCNDGSTILFTPTEGNKIQY